MTLNRIPKVGETIRFTDKCIKGLVADTFKKFAGHNLFVDEVQKRVDGAYWTIHFHSLVNQQTEDCAIHSDGTICGARTALVGIPIFELVDPFAWVEIKIALGPDIYCSCDGPRKGSMTFNGEPFDVCIVCKKEKRPS